MSSGHSHGSERAVQKRVLWIALALNGTFMVAEIVGGIAFNSLALLADAAHMVSDVAGLSIALVAQSLMDRPASARHTFGLQRAEVLGAQANALTLLAASGWILLEAFRRLDSPEEVGAQGMLIVAGLGLAVNVGSAIVIACARGSSLNLRGALLHMVGDAAGSVGAIAAGAGMLVWGVRWPDPVASIAIAGLVLWSGWHLLRETTHVLLEGTPRGMSVVDVERELANDPRVDSVHHVHLWNLASDVPALSAHVVVAEEGSLHDAQLEGDRLRLLLHDRFGIEHSTLELECHSCEPASASTH